MVINYGYDSLRINRPVTDGPEHKAIREAIEALEKKSHSVKVTRYPDNTLITGVDLNDVTGVINAFEEVENAPGGLN